MKKILIALTLCGCIQLSGMCMYDISSPMHPANPLNPMNPANPAGPVHQMLFAPPHRGGHGGPMGPMSRGFRPYAYGNRCLNSIQACFNFGGGFACANLCH